MKTFNLKTVKTGRSAVRAIFLPFVFLAFCLASSFVFSTSVLAVSGENPCAVINNFCVRNPCAGLVLSDDPAVTTPDHIYYEDFSPKIEYITPDRLKIYVIPDYFIGGDNKGSAPDWTGVVEGLGTTREREKDGDDLRDATATDDDGATRAKPND